MKTLLMFAVVTVASGQPAVAQSTVGASNDTGTTRGTPGAAATGTNAGTSGAGPSGPTGSAGAVEMGSGKTAAQTRAAIRKRGEADKRAARPKRAATGQSGSTHTTPGQY